MSRLIIVIMEENEYPFGECDNSQLEKKKVMVRKRVEFHPFQKKNMLLKAKKIKSFINPFIIKLQQLLQQQSSLHLLFEYIPIKIETWISNINTQFIENFRQQLLELADYLAENSIVIDFKLKNIGMDQNYLPKYFIGLDYEINTLMGKDLLLEKYRTQISEIINPYRVNTLDQKKVKLMPEPNPQFPQYRTSENLKRENQKSAKQISPFRAQGRASQTQPSQRDSIKKIGNLSEYDMKLTFDGSQKILFDNLPKNISTNLKIEHIGRKINDLKNMIQNISGKPIERVERKHDSVSLSPMKGVNEERPNSSYQKGVPKQQLPASANVLKVCRMEKSPLKTGQGQSGGKIVVGKELRQTQSQSEYSKKVPDYKRLDRVNQKMHINEVRTKNEVRVVGANKQSYIYEFQRLLNDDIDQFASKDVPYQKKQVDTKQLRIQATLGQNEQKSPRFGFTSAPVEIYNFKTEPQRFSYSHNVKKRKKSSESSKSNTSQIQDRVNAVIGASRKLINNFRKSKAGEREVKEPLVRNQ